MVKDDLRLFSLLATLFFAGALGTGAACSAAPLRIMPLGDSNTSGPTWATGSYRTRLWQDFGSDPNRVTFVGSLLSGPAALGSKRHEGHSGFTIAFAPPAYSLGFGNITDRIAQYLSPTVNPDVILLMLGTNDVNRNYLVDEAPARLDHLIGLISDRVTGLKPDAKLLVGSIPPINDAKNGAFRSTPTDFSANARIMAFNAALPGLVAARRARGEQVYFVDLNAALTLDDIADGLHPTAAGFDKLGDAWYSAIQRIPEPSSFLLCLVACFAGPLSGAKRPCIPARRKMLPA